jgi:hypothetical protein
MTPPTQRDKLKKIAKANGWSITERTEQNETRYARKGQRILVRWQYDTASYIRRNGQPWLDTTDTDRIGKLTEVLEAT